MKSLQEFLQNFFKNKGQYVFFSLLIAKICGLISSIAVVRMLPQSDFGGEATSGGAGQGGHDQEGHLRYA